MVLINSYTPNQYLLWLLLHDKTKIINFLDNFCSLSITMTDTEISDIIHIIDKFNIPMINTRLARSN